jgi:hypothetical protein
MLRRVAQGRPQPCHEFADAEWLVAVVVRTKIKDRDLLFFLITSLYDDDGYGRPFAEFGDHILAVQVGKSEIEKDCIRRFIRGQCQRFRSRGGGDDLVARCGRVRLLRPCVVGPFGAAGLLV